MNILVVDDSKFVRLALRKSLEQYFGESCTILEAPHGLLAIEILKSNKVDIIFLDYNMPIMNGEDVVESVRSNTMYRDIKIIMATTDGTKEKVLRLMKKGVNGYLVKPFSDASIAKMLDRVTARR